MWMDVEFNVLDKDVDLWALVAPADYSYFLLFNSNPFFFLLLASTSVSYNLCRLSLFSEINTVASAYLKLFYIVAFYFNS